MPGGGKECKGRKRPERPPWAGSEPSFGDLGRTWDRPVFYSFLFGKAGAQAWSSDFTLVFFMFLGFISRCKVAVPTSQVHANRQHLSVLALVGPRDEPASTSIRASSVSCMWQCWVCVKHPALTLGGDLLTAKWELPGPGSCFVGSYPWNTEEL